MASNGDPLVPAVVPVVVAPEPRPGERVKLKCEFCETELVGKGDYVKLSERAKMLRGLEEANEKLQTEMAALRKENEAFKAAVPKESPKKSWIDR